MSYLRLARQGLENFLDGRRDKIANEVRSAFKPFLGLCAEDAEFQLADSSLGMEKVYCAIQGATGRNVKEVIRVPFGQRITGGTRRLIPFEPFGSRIRGLARFCENWSETREEAESALKSILAIPMWKYSGWLMTGHIHSFFIVREAISLNLQGIGVGKGASEMVGANFWHAAFGALWAFGENDEGRSRAFLNLLREFQRAFVIGEVRHDRGTWVAFVKNTAG